MKYDESNKMITTERLVIRLFQESDVVNVANLCNNYNIYKNTQKSFPSADIRVS